MKQLKSDFIREVGPRDQRPSAVLFRSWLVQCQRDARHGDKDDVSLAIELSKSFKSDPESLPVLPLPLFSQQIQSSSRDCTSLSNIFPKLLIIISISMSFSRNAISGNEDICLRPRAWVIHTIPPSHRFSGTPSNLLPVDLGECKYEKGSDGKMLVTLTDESVATVVRVGGTWNARNLLRTIASEGAYHALIDTGALITGMDNEQVAKYVLDHLPERTFDGVVFLDRSDRKMFLQRDGRCVNLSQSGVDPARRFTFYDQVHTTGLDVHQCVDARACLTVGKDMTFRDYVQGAYRMRGIGKGQTIDVLLIPGWKTSFETSLLITTWDLFSSVCRRGFFSTRCALNLCKV